MTGENIGAEEAHRIGLVDFLVEPDQLQAKLDELCEKFKRVAPTSFKIGLIKWPSGTASAAARINPTKENPARMAP